MSAAQRERNLVGEGDLVKIPMAALCFFWGAKGGVLREHIAVIMMKRGSVNRI